MKNTSPWKGTRVETLRLTLPCQFLMLCALTEVDPERVLYDFMTAVGAESYGPGRAVQKTAEDYFVQAGYGQHHYSRDDIRQIVRELGAISSLWPRGAKPDFVTQHASWRNNYHQYWFKRWFDKIRRRLA